jgi:hypothetical protein
MELSGETEICGTHVAAAPGRRRRNQQVNVKASVETIEKFLKAADDRTIALCRSANVCAFWLLLLKGLEPRRQPFHLRSSGLTMFSIMLQRPRASPCFHHIAASVLSSQFFVERPVARSYAGTSNVFRVTARSTSS